MFLRLERYLWNRVILLSLSSKCVSQKCESKVWAKCFAKFPINHAIWTQTGKPAFHCGLHEVVLEIVKKRCKRFERRTCPQPISFPPALSTHLLCSLFGRATAVFSECPFQTDARRKKRSRNTVGFQPWKCCNITIYLQKMASVERKTREKQKIEMQSLKVRSRQARPPPRGKLQNIDSPFLGCVNRGCLKGLRGFPRHF